MRVVFFGTPAFAVPTLSALLASRHQVVAVVTQPDKPRGRGQRMSDAPVKELAIARGLPVLQPLRLAGDAFVRELQELHADLGVVAAYGKILPEWMLETPPHGMINVHASLLPKYRGAAPVHRAVMNGDTETGVTIMRVVKALDAGPMMATAVRPIGIDETSEVVERDLAAMGASLLLDVVEDLAAGRARELPQDDAKATYAPRLTKEEGLLDFALPSVSVHNRVRGLRPWPTAYTFLNGRRLVIHQTKLADLGEVAAAPGQCVAAGAAGITVACGDARGIVILQLQPEGRRVMSARDYLAGHGVLVGRTFG
jgi:methionyl-tRNA formyltransferase